MSSRTDIAVVWRNDGVIEYIIPAITVVNTFFATVLRHSKWLCQFIDELALVTTQGNAPESIDGKQNEILAALRKGLYESAESHVLLEESQSRLKVGTKDYFPGMFYGTMHPTELAALADRIVEIVGTTDKGRDAIDTIIVWRDAAKKFVRPSERIGSLLGEAGVA